MNPGHVEEVHHRPKAVDFARYVQRNRPVVFRGLGFDMQIPALNKWNEAYLCGKLGEIDLKIAATPEG